MIEHAVKFVAILSGERRRASHSPVVVKLLVDILDPQEGESVYDPACGTGGMLIEVIEHVKASGGRAQTLWGKLYGQEKVLATSSIARMNLLLHGVEDFRSSARTPCGSHHSSLAPGLPNSTA